MPFKEVAALEKIYRVKYRQNGQDLTVWYDSGKKFAEVQEKFSDIEEEDAPTTLKERKLFVAQQICGVVEKWDYELEDGSILEVDPEAFVDRGWPLEFYTGLMNAILEHYNERGEGAKKA